MLSSQPLLSINRVLPTRGNGGSIILNPQSLPLLVYLPASPDCFLPLLRDLRETSVRLLGSFALSGGMNVAPALSCPPSISDIGRGALSTAPLQSLSYSSPGMIRQLTMKDSNSVLEVWSVMARCLSS